MQRWQSYFLPLILEFRSCHFISTCYRPSNLPACSLACLATPAAAPHDQLLELLLFLPLCPGMLNFRKRIANVDDDDRHFLS
jgi:hypothetical protein